MNIRNITGRIRVLALATMLAACALTASAQSPDEEPVSRDIVEIIQETSGGAVTVDIPANLKKLVAPVTKKTEAAPEPETTKREQRRRVLSSGPKQSSGFRIQIFSDGRDQRTLKSRAQQRSNSVVARFPKYRNQVYSFSKAPNWYTRIGNFRTQADANAALAELRRAFPGFAGEMRVVRSNIIVVD